MKNYGKHLGIAIAHVLAITVAPSALSATFVIEEDTTIDALSPYSGSSIEVIDGGDGPTGVNIVTGGSINGFLARENSQIILDGGGVTFLSTLEGNASLIVNSGEIACSESICQVIDYDALLEANDSSTFHFFGGTVGGILRLHDSSIAHFYGQNLSLNIFGDSFAQVEGSYSNGDPVAVTFHFRPDIASHIVFHNVPEQGVSPVLVALVWFILGRRNK